MVGIGGIGMQALCDVLLAMGHQITGSDIAEFSGKERLIQKGAKIIIGPQVAENIPDNIDGLIYTSAILHHQGLHPEVEKARSLGVSVWKRSEFIGELMKTKYSIAVSGTHGKTTVSTLLTLMLQAGGLDPTALIGAEVKSLAGAGVSGKGEPMVVEASEYDSSFLDMNFKVAILTNIDDDHLDYFKDIEDIKQTFVKFLNKVPADGYAAVCGDDPHIQEILPKVNGQIMTFGFGKDNDLVAKNVFYQGTRMHFEVDGFKTFLNFPGKHLIIDALAAIVVARKLGVLDQTIKQVLENDFKGADRRFEILGTYKGITFVDDYGHHPTEIQMFLSAIKDFFSQRRLIVVFQAHQYSRTKLLLEGFAKSFSDVDQVLVAPIWAVRDSEEDKKSIDNFVLAEKINVCSHNAKAFSSFDEISEEVYKIIQPGDVLISLGAGKNSEWIKKFIHDYKE